MAGAEGERSLDLDGDGIAWDARALVRAMHDKTAGAHRRQVGQTLRHPVSVGDGLEAQRLCRRVAGDQRHLRAHRFLVGRIAKVNRQLPLPAVVLERRADRVGVQAFAQRGEQAAGGRLVAGQTGDNGGHGRYLQRLVKRLAMAISGTQ